MAGFMADEHTEEMGEINMIPFIDVMLVLLIVFIITVPAMKHAVNVQLPTARNEKVEEKPQTVRLSVAVDGSFYVDADKVDDDQLGVRLRQLAVANPQTQLHIRGDRDVRYERVALAMATAAQAGLSNIGFITEPKGP